MDVDQEAVVAYVYKYVDDEVSVEKVEYAKSK